MTVLPPLPESAHLWSSNYMNVYTAEQVQAYARAAVAAEREACARLVDPTDEHRRDSSWGYLGGEQGVELLDAIAAAIRARGEGNE
jgi:hypothetical protein